MDQELESLLARVEQRKAMEKSCTEFEKKLFEDVQEFLAKHFDIQKGAEFHVLELVKRARKS